MVVPAAAQQQHIGDQPEAMNMRLVGYNDLQARGAYSSAIHKQGGRYIAYIGHHGGSNDIPKPINKMTGQAEFNGTSILDVTDPAHPVYLKHIPGAEGKYEEGGAQMVRVCDGKLLPKGDPAKTYMLRVFGGQGHEVWDVTDPANPALLARLMGLADTHKNFWECDTGIAYPRLRRARLAGQAHDPDLRSQRSRPSRAYPRLRAARPGARRDRHDPDPCCTARSRWGRRATGCISATAPTRAACSRSSTARSFSTGRRSRRRRTCAIRK